MSKILMKKFIVGALFFAPLFASAQAFGNVEGLLSGIQSLINIALPIVAGLALLAFFWGLVKFIFSQGNEEAKGDGKKLMGWGLVALFVMVAVWGLVGFIGDALGVTGTGGSVDVPTVNFN